MPDRLLQRITGPDDSDGRRLELTLAIRDDAPVWSVSIHDAGRTSQSVWHPLPSIAKLASLGDVVVTRVTDDIEATTDGSFVVTVAVSSPDGHVTSAEYDARGLVHAVRVLEERALRTQA